MNKYIRTKDGRIIIQGGPNDKGFEKGRFEIHNINHNALDSIEIIKQADTIEELCDELVYNDKFFKNVIYKDISSVKTLCSIRKEWTVYGAIWTDKGLIYVAKMNDKGELELI